MFLRPDDLVAVLLDLQSGASTQEAGERNT
jgi:hypothetical protein